VRSLRSGRPPGAGGRPVAGQMMPARSGDRDGGPRFSEAVAEDLARQGVRQVFGILGEDIAELGARLAGCGISYLTARHENQAVAMADGYSRVTGGLGVALLTGGPGFSNALTAINTASRAASGVLVIVGTGTAASKYLAHDAVAAAAGVMARTLTSPSLAEVRDALTWAQSGRTVVLTLPTAVLAAPAVEAVAPPADRAEPAPVDQEAVTRVADFLGEQWAVARPVIVAGRGAYLAGAAGQLQELGRLTGALLATTLRAVALFGDDEWNIGVAGTYSTPAAGELLRKADCVIAVGASLNRFTTYGNSLFPDAQVVQIDRDPGAFGRHIAVDGDLTIHGDARTAVEMLLTTLTERGHHSPGYRTAATRKALAADSAGSAGHAPGRPHPGELAAAIDKIVPRARNVVVDGGHFAVFFIANMRAERPGCFFQTNDAGSIGLSLGAAIGASVARPQVWTVAGIGDAAFMMALGDLDTAVRQQLPLLIVVGNDQSLGMEVHYMRLNGLEPDGVATCATPSLAVVAAALGARSFTISHLSELAAVEPELQDMTGPIVLDCRIDPAVAADIVPFVFGAPA
jgi:acetolactate synthase I/II/III large subunit